MIFRRQLQGVLAGVDLGTISRLLAIMVLATCLLGLPQRAQAAQYQWIGGDATYDSRGNWDFFIVPGAGDIAYFPDHLPDSHTDVVHTVDTLSGGLTVGEMDFLEYKA